MRLKVVHPPTLVLALLLPFGFLQAEWAEASMVFDSIGRSASIAIRLLIPSTIPQATSTPIPNRQLPDLG
jgi:hypothetical protein